jgi:hypothetical protein
VTSRSGRATKSCSRASRAEPARPPGEDADQERRDAARPLEGTRTPGPVARPLGSLAARLGRWDLCEELFGRTLRYSDALGSPTLRALTELEHARALSGHPHAAERARGRSLLDAAGRKPLAATSIAVQLDPAAPGR